MAESGPSTSQPGPSNADPPAAHVYPHPNLPYYGHPNWQGHPWPLNGYQYTATYHQPFIQQHPHQPTQFRQYQPPNHTYSPAPLSAPHAQLPKPSTKRKVRTRTTSPSPSPKEFPRHWDAALKAFFLAVGLSQSLAGLEADILVMNPDWERKVVPDALGDLQSTISQLLSAQPNCTGMPVRTLEERKLDYVHVEKGLEARSPGAINKSISELLARNRARNDASNRAEFLHPRQTGNPSEDRPSDEGDEIESTSCSRTDAKTVDRDVMMKFDIAKNEEGPLRRTLKAEVRNNSSRPANKNCDGDNSVTADRHPGVDERLKNLETHLVMRYVPSPPASLLHRIKFIEDHIIQLEREYPPWAALHFNQPRRGWPPPPRSTPVIVPSHLTSNPITEPSSSSTSVAESSIPAPATYSGKAMTEVRTKGRGSRSSLHRAVLEKLEVQRAIEDLKGEGEHS